LTLFRSSRRDFDRIDQKRSLDITDVLSDCRQP
jgi:hypothetical protein